MGGSLLSSGKDSRAMEVATPGNIHSGIEGSYKALSRVSNPFRSFPFSNRDAITYGASD